MKIVVNRCWGGFGLSEVAVEKYLALKGIKYDGHFYDGDIPRDDIDLVVVVEALDSASWGGHSHLEVVEIPDDVKWQIHDYDGMETIQEKHREW